MSNVFCLCLVVILAWRGAKLFSLTQWLRSRLEQCIRAYSGLATGSNGAFEHPVALEARWRSAFERTVASEARSSIAFERTVAPQARASSAFERAVAPQQCF